MNAETVAYAVGAVGVVPTYFLINKWAQGAVYNDNDTRMDGKVVIITGANCGIGLETALDLAKRGGRIYLACRDLVKADVARMKIIHSTGNRNIFTGKLDLSSFESIHEFVHKFKKSEAQLHLLINNAGVLTLSPRELTSDGLEMHIGTNHFGHFLLTNLLLPMLRQSAPARIINVASHMHKFGKIHRDDLQLEKTYSQWGSYGQSKLANILFTRELAKRLEGSGVTANSLHPGVVKTEITRHMSFLLNFLLAPFRLFYKTPKSGAQTSIMLAVDPKLEKVSGKYFSDCALYPEAERAQDDDTASWLWDVSETITKLK